MTQVLVAEPIIDEGFIHDNLLITGMLLQATPPLPDDSGDNADYDLFDERGQRAVAVPSLRHPIEPRGLVDEPRGDPAASGSGPTSDSAPKRKSRSGASGAPAKRQKKESSKNGALVSKWQNVAKSLDEDDVRLN